MSEFLKKNWTYIIIALMLSTLVSYGVSDFFNFFKAYSLTLPLISLGLYYYESKFSKNTEEREIIQTLDQIIGEQTQVIEDYEKIFDSQMVQLPCVCGANTFEGLFSPNLDNIVECEKCKNKYRVDINYNSVLISEPMDLNKSFDDLIEENIN